MEKSTYLFLHVKAVPTIPRNGDGRRNQQNEHQGNLKVRKLSEIYLNHLQGATVLMSLAQIRKKYEIGSTSKMHELHE